MISACMIVQNEEECIARCLDSITDYVDEIIVVDGGSTDSTKDIISAYPKAKIYEIPFEKNFGNQRNNAIERANGDWIFIIDADEYCYPYVMERLQYLTTLEYDAYTFTRKTLINGVLVNPLNLDDTYRFFRSYCRYDGDLHEPLTKFNKNRATNMEIIHDKKAEWQQKDNELYWDMGQTPPDGWKKLDGKWVYNENKVLLSALLCVYNEELMLRQCLTNLTKFVDEIVIVDGGPDGVSTDGTKLIIDEFLQAFPEMMKYYSGVFSYEDGSWNEPDQVNFGLSKVTGKYIMRTQPDLVYDVDTIVTFLIPALEIGKKHYYCPQVDFWGDTKHILLYKQNQTEDCLWHQITVDPLAVRTDCNYRAVAVGDNKQFGMTADIDYNTDSLYLPHVKKYHFGFVKPFKYQVEKTVTYAKCGLMGNISRYAPLKELYSWAIGHVSESFFYPRMEYVGDFPPDGKDFEDMTCRDGRDQFIDWFQNSFNLKDFTKPTKLGYDNIDLGVAKGYAESTAWQLPAHDVFDPNAIAFCRGEQKIKEYIHNNFDIKSYYALDIGCANAVFLTYLKKMGLAVGIGIDISEKAIEYAKQTARNNNAELDFYALPIETFETPYKFNIIKMTEVIEHIIDIPYALKKISTLLEPGGLLFGTAPVANICDGQAHLHYFVEDDLRNLLEEHFSIVELYKIDYNGNGELHHLFICGRKQ